eukprot:6476576-Amphidinium_carterae.2
MGQRAPVGTVVIRVTQDDDLLCASTVRQVVELLQSSSWPILVWVSVPCTTGCTWLRTMPHLRTDEKHLQKVKHDRCLTENAMTIVKCAIDAKRI